MGTVTLGAEDLFPQSQIAPKFPGNQLLYEAVIRTTITPNDITVATILFHGIDPISGFVAGFYSLDTLYTREINGIPEVTVRVPLTGQINPLGLNEAPPVANDYNVIQIRGGSGIGTTATGQKVTLNILPFTVFSREETVVLPFKQ